jgi:DNA-3-methyladenine glycosylase II
MFLTDDPIIRDHIDWLLVNDPIFQKHFSKNYKIDRARGEDGMAGLIRIIIGQQVSTAAARSMWQKFSDKFNINDPESLVRADDEDLRVCGLSRQKIGYVRGLALAVIEKKIDIASWNHKSTDQVTKEITSLKGFGLWSAHMFLMFNLARPDVWPHGDLGIQSGLGIYLGLGQRPDEKETLAKAHLFKGRETAAALLLWSIKDDGV